MSTVRSSCDSVHFSEVVSADAPQLVFRTHVSVLLHKLVAMDGRFGGPSDVSDEFQTADACSFMNKIFGRKVAESEVFPPDSLTLAAVPIEHEREQPP